MNEGRITRYATVSAEKLEGLEVEVNKAIALGWQPLGGIALAERFNTRIHYVQALVSYDAAPGSGQEELPPA